MIHPFLISKNYKFKLFIESVRLSKRMRTCGIDIILMNGSNHIGI